MNLTYKLFIASSFNLYKERDQLEIAINRLNKEYFHQEQFIETVRWEALDGGISKTRMQDDTNNALLECDILVMLVWGELGKFTYEEFKVAHEAFLRGKLKKIYVFEKNLPLPEGFNSNIENQENLKKLKHFFSAEGREYWPTAFEHIAEVNLHLTYWLKDVFSNKLNPDFSIALRQGAKRLSLNGPARPDIFLGREKELKEISQRLKTQTNLLLINAEGGIGKTTLAAQYWYDSMLDYKYHAWLYCEEGILKALLTMATEMGIIFSGPVSMEEQIHELKVKLKDIEDGFFLVLDNANNEAEIEKFKKEFKGWNWRVLFTSRCHLVLNDREEMLIAHLPPNLAKELFLTYYREEHNNFNSQLDQVLSAVNYHTLLIEVFAKNLAKAARIGYTMTGFLQQLEQGGLFLSEHSFKIKSEWGSLNDVANSDDIIAAIYDFSSLPEKEKYTLLNLAFLPADTYNLSFLLSLFANGQGKREYVDAIENLVHWGWLNESGDTYRLSPVIQKLMLLKEKENLEIASNSLMERLSDLLYCDAYNLLNLSLKEALPYVNLVKHCCQCLTAFPSEDIANLHFGCVIFHGNLGNVSAEMEHAKQYQEIYLCLHEMDPENLSYKNGLAISYSKLGGIYEATGDWQNALKNYESQLNLFLEIYASSPENLRYKNGLAISYSKLGGIYEATGDWQNALKNYESQLNLFLEIYASSPENLRYKNGLAISYSKLGGIYEATGDWQNALKNYESQLNLFLEIYASSPENLSYKNGLAISYSKLGGIYEATGDWQNALKNFEKDFRITQEIYASSPENLSYKNGLAISYEKLGGIYEATGDWQNALKNYESQLNLFLEIYASSPENLRYKNGLAISYSKLGGIYEATGDWQNALKNYESQLNLFLEIYASSPENLSYKNGLAISYEKLGGIYEATGDWQNALKNYEERNKLGKEIYASSPENLSYKNGLAISYSKLGGIYEATGDWQNALKNFEKDFRITQEIYASSPENLRYKNGLAISYIKLGIIQLNENILNKAAAKELLEKAFQIYQEIRAMAPEIHEYEKNYTWLDNKLKELM